MLTKRVISAIIGIIILIAVVFGGNVFIRIGVALLSLVGLYELFSVTGIIKKKGLALIGYLGALVIAVEDIIGRDKIIMFFYGYVILLAVYILINHRKVSLQHIAIVFFAQIYICYFFFHIVLTNALPYGNVFIWMIFLGAWTTDTFAYFTGMLLGKTHPWPYISPKKTLEGSIGGVVGCGLSFLL